MLIPTWNRVAPVVAAVKSVGNVSTDLEIIVVDNASDNLLYLELQKQLEPFPNVLVFRNNSNIGMVRNWNRCIELASGTWQGLLCSDDSYRPDAIGRILEILRSIAEPSLIVQDATVSEDLQQCLPGSRTVRNLRLPIASGNFWHRDIVARVGSFDERFEYSADAEYWYRIASYFPVLKVRKPFALYEQHETNYMWQTWRKGDYLEQSTLLAQTVARHMFHGTPEAESMISNEVEVRVWSTLTTIIENTFIHKGRSDIFARYFPEAMRRAGNFSRKKELLLKLLYAVKHRLDASMTRSSVKKEKG